MHGNVFVNRTLNMKRISYLGLDMDHTLVRYKSKNFEKLSHTIMVDKLVREKGYPEVLRNLPFNYDLAIRGLVLDKKRGNLIKVNRHGAIRMSYHGTQPLDFKSQQKMYKTTYLDLSDSNYLAIDTTFSISLATLFMQIVDCKNAEKNRVFPDFTTIAEDVLLVLDEAHKDGSIKNLVQQNLDHYIIRDERVVAGLERFKRHGKKIFVLTNSDFFYTKLLMDYAINPFLKDHSHWTDLFTIVVTYAQKPRFFYDNLKFLKVNIQDGLMSNVSDKLGPGVYQGGCASVFTNDLSVEGDQILYIGDHIYGDILRLKKACNWRTAMVIEELEQEIMSNKRAAPLTDEIDLLMKKKEPLEDELTDHLTARFENTQTGAEGKISLLQKQIADIDSSISHNIREQNQAYNSLWGPLMRAGGEESYFAYQVDRYACVYMPTLADILDHSPRTYFRAAKRLLAHENV